MKLKTYKGIAKADKLKLCSGCRNNFYNGNNTLGIKECWFFEKANIVLKKRVHMDQSPPWNQAPVTVLDCYRESGYVYFDPKVTC